MASLRLAALPLLQLLLLTPASARAQAPAGVELSLYGEASRHLGGGARVDYALGQLGPGRVGLGAELGAGHCARHCLRVIYGLFHPEVGQLEPGQSLEDLLGGASGPLPGNAAQVLLPSLRASYHLDFQHGGLLSLTDVYGLVFVGAAGLQATYRETPDGAPVAHSGWAPSVGLGVGVRQVLGRSAFLGLELRGRLGSAHFGEVPLEQRWTVAGPGLTLSAGTSF